MNHRNLNRDKKDSFAAKICIIMVNGQAPNIMDYFLVLRLFVIISIG